jgi:hypothetical protein
VTGPDTEKLVPTVTVALVTVIVVWMVAA